MWARSDSLAKGRWSTYESTETRSRPRPAMTKTSIRCISDVFHLLRANGFTVKCATYYRQGGDPKSWQERVDAFSGSFPVPVKVQVAQNVAGGLRDPGDLALAMDALEAAITYKSTHSLLGTRPLQQHCDQNASTSPTPLAPPPKLIHDGAIVSPPDAFVIVSCDLDFLPLYRRLVAQKASCYVIADAARVSDRRCADLKEVCTEVFLMNRGAGRPDNRNLVVDAAAGAGGANTSSVAAGGPAGSSCNAAALLDGTTSTQEATTSKEGGPPKTRIFGQVDHQNGVPARSSEADDATFLADTIQAGLSDGKSLRARASAVGKVLVRYGYLQRVHENETEIPLTPTAMATFLENCGIFEWRTLLGSGATTTSGTTKKGDREKVDLEGLVGLCFAKLEEMAANSSVAKAKIQPWSKQRVLAAPAADHGQRVPPLEVERPFEIFTATYKDAVAGRTVFPSKTAMFVAHVLKKLGYYQFDDIQDIRCVVEQAECESSAVLSNPNPCLIEAVDVFMVRNKYLRKKWRPIICDWVQASQDNTIAPAAGSSASVPRVLKEVLEEIYPGWTTALDGPQKVAILARLMTSTNHQRRFELAPQRASLVEFAKAGIVWPPTAGTTFVGGGSGSGEPFPVIVEQAASGNEPLTDREMLHYDAQLRTWLQKSCPSLMAVGVGTQAHDLKSSWRNFYTTLTIAHTVVRNQHNPQVRKTSPSLSLTAAVPLKNTTNITAGAVDRTETTGTNTGLGVPIGAHPKEIHGVLWELSQEDFLTLVSQEFYYEVEAVTIEIYPEDRPGDFQDALVFRTTTQSTVAAAPNTKPSARYINLIVDGAREVGRPWYLTYYIPLYLSIFALWICDLERCLDMRSVLLPDIRESEYWRWLEEQREIGKRRHYEERVLTMLGDVAKMQAERPDLLQKMNDVAKDLHNRKEEEEENAPAAAPKRPAPAFEALHEEQERSENHLLDEVKHEHIYRIPGVVSILIDLSVVFVFITFIVTGMNLCRHHNRMGEIGDLFHGKEIGRTAADEEDQDSRSRSGSGSCSRDGGGTDVEAAQLRLNTALNLAASDVRAAAKRSKRAGGTKKTAASMLENRENLLFDRRENSASSGADDDEDNAHDASGAPLVKEASSVALSFPEGLATKKPPHGKKNIGTTTQQVILLPVVYSLLAFKSTLRMSELMSGTVHHDRISNTVAMLWNRLWAGIGLGAGGAAPGIETAAPDVLGDDESRYQPLHVRERKFSQYYEANFFMADLYVAWALWCFSRLCVGAVRNQGLRKNQHDRMFDPLRKITLLGVQTFVVVNAVGAAFQLALVLCRGLSSRYEVVNAVLERHEEFLESLESMIFGAGLIASMGALYNIVAFERHMSQFLRLFQPKWKFWSAKVLLSLGHFQLLFLNIAMRLGLLSEQQKKLLFATLVTLECLPIAVINLKAWDAKAHWAREPEWSRPSVVKH
eukprot:g1482.t1